MSLERLTTTIDEHRRVVVDAQEVDYGVATRSRSPSLTAPSRPWTKSGIGMAEVGVVTLKKRIEVEGVFEHVGGPSCGDSCQDCRPWGNREQVVGMGQ